MAPRTSPFRMVSEFAPAGDQPGAIAALGAGVGNGERYQTLLGITGSGKSATIAWTDTYIEKDSSINDEIDRLRHSATAALLTRRDVIVVASVSCIYGLGSPEEYRENVLFHLVGDQIDQRSLLRRLVEIQYARNDQNFTRGTFRVRGDTLEIIP